MIKKNSVMKNSVWIIACKVIQSLLSLVVGMLTARYLGPSNYGLVNYAASVVAFVTPFMKLGFNHILVNEFLENKEKEGEILGTAIVFNAISAIACMVGVSSFVYVSNPNEPITWIVCALYSLSLFGQAMEMVQYWFQAKLISQYTSLTSLAAYLVVTAYKIYLLVSQKNICWFAVSQALDYFIVSLVLLVFFRKLSFQKLSVSFKRFKDMFSKSRYFIISSLMITVFAQTDKIMLKMMLSDEAVGMYSAAVTCAGMTSFVFAAIIDSVRPSVLEKKKISVDVYEKNLIMCYSVVIYLSLAQSFIFSVFSGLIINLLYGSQYIGAAGVLSLVVWYTTFSYLGAVRSIWILAENKQKYLWIINSSGAIMNVILNAVLIPVMGVMGAALSSLFTQIFTNVIVGFIMKPIRYNNYLMLKGCNPKPLIIYIKQAITKLRKRGDIDV